MPCGFAWRSASEGWSKDNLADTVRTMLYQLHVVSGSEHEDIRLALGADGRCCLHAARDLKAH